MKTIRGTTPSFNISFYDANGLLVDPTSAYTQIEIKLYNIHTGTEIVNYSTKDPLPDGYILLVPDSDGVDIVIPAANTLETESGDNRIEVWTTDTAGIIECNTCVFNEFIDAKDVS